MVLSAGEHMDLTATTRMAALWSLALLLGCPEAPTAPTPGAGATEKPPSQLVNGAINRLPKDADGNIPVLTVGNEVMKLGPVIRDPVYAAGRCTDLLGACMVGEHLHPMDCARKVHTCATAEPWNEAAPCCPKACVDEAVRREASGIERELAYAGVFDQTHPCFPGLLEQYCAAGGKPVGGCPVSP